MEVETNNMSVRVNEMTRGKMRSSVAAADPAGQQNSGGSTARL